MFHLKETPHVLVRLLRRRGATTIQRHLPHSCKESHQRIENALRTMTKNTRWHKERQENPRTTSTPSLTLLLLTTPRHVRNPTFIPKGTACTHHIEIGIRSSKRLGTSLSKRYSELGKKVSSVVGSTENRLGTS